MRFILMIAIVLFLPWTAAAFQSIHRQTLRTRTTWTTTTTVTTTSPTVLGAVEGTDIPSPLSYSEQSRKYRRDFFTHDSWLRHRSNDRFVGTLIKIFDSGVVRALAEELYLGKFPSNMDDFPYMLHYFVQVLMALSLFFFFFSDRPLSFLLIIVMDYYQQCELTISRVHYPKLCCANAISFTHFIVLCLKNTMIS